MLDKEVKILAQGNNFAAFTTLLPGGAPMTHAMWVDADDAHLLINTEVHRRKFLNVTADPRVAVMVIDATNSYHYAEVRGRVVATVTGPEARQHIDFLSQKYNGTLFPGENIKSERVILRIAPNRQRVN